MRDPPQTFIRYVAAGSPMGHDITAYHRRFNDPGSTGGLGEEIAYLRGNYGIYNAIDATECDGGVSGNAGSRWFARKELEEGLHRLLLQEEDLQKKGWSNDPAIQFLRACLARFPTDEERIWIWFC